MPVKIETPRLIIAAPHSGAGKTLVTMGLAAWLGKEMDLRPFKIGPDYIDPVFLEAGAGRPAVNLDGWLLAKERVADVFYRHAHGGNLALIEGAMGLFDGKGSGDQGSAAQIARWLKAPVILVVDAARCGRSLAALVGGFRDFDRRLKLAGVFLNRVGSPSHLKTAREAIENLAGLPVVGYLPRDPELAVSSRHLGLAPPPKAVLVKLARRAAAALAAGTDKKALLRAAAAATPVSFEPAQTLSPASERVKIAVARDDAFSFYYHDSLALLRSLGATVEFFSPLNDAALPAKTQGLFFGGGWPELRADRLAANDAMREAILSAAEKKMPIYAECGGLIYLTKSLKIDGRALPMVGLLPAAAAMTDARQGLGYRRAKLNRPTILGGKGLTLRGHEFHWSRIRRLGGRGFDHAYEYEDGSREGFASDNVLASYLHLNWNHRPELALNFLSACARGGQC